MKYLVLDTNVFVQDFRMEGNAFDALLGNYSAVADKVIIPKIVYQETLNQYAQRVSKETDGIKNAFGNLRKLVGPEVEELETKEVETFVGAYVKHFDSKFQFVSHEIADYPEVSHEHVAQKAIKKEKPFKRTGEGYCDALIWETILELLRKDNQCEVIFVSNNKSDFWTGESLADELVADLNSYGISPQRVKIYNTIRDVVDKLLLHQLATLALLKDQINSGSVPDIELDDWIADKLFDAIDKHDAGFAIAGVDTDECTVELSEIYRVFSVQADEVKVLNGNEKYLLISAEIGLGVDVCADWYQYDDSEKVASIFDKCGIGEPAEYECVYVNGNVDVEMSIIIQDEDFANARLEVISLSGIGGSVG